MATTTNYGWDTPDDTDLVKDGASAIRTLGSSIDTTTKNLNPQTTTGAIAYRSATSNVNTSLPIGTAGQVLTVNSGATAPEWTTITAGMTLLSTTNLSGTSTTISGISTAYNELLVIINNPHTNIATQLRIDPNGSSGIATYSGTFSASADSGTEMRPPVNMATASQVNNVHTLIINNYSGTTYGKPYIFYGATNNSAATSFNIAGIIQTASAITSLKFATNNGTSTFSGGQVLIYGVK